VLYFKSWETPLPNAVHQSPRRPTRSPGGWPTCRRTVRPVYQRAAPRSGPAPRPLRRCWIRRARQSQPQARRGHARRCGTGGYRRPDARRTARRDRGHRTSHERVRRYRGPPGVRPDTVRAAAPGTRPAARRQRPNLLVAAEVTRVKKLTRLPSGNAERQRPVARGPVDEVLDEAGQFLAHAAYVADEELDDDGVVVGRPGSATPRAASSSGPAGSTGPRPAS
jgi:hypothetical protein